MSFVLDSSGAVVLDSFGNPVLAGEGGAAPLDLTALASRPESDSGSAFTPLSPSALYGRKFSLIVASTSSSGQLADYDRLKAQQSQLNTQATGLIAKAQALKADPNVSVAQLQGVDAELRSTTQAIEQNSAAIRSLGPVSQAPPDGGLDLSELQCQFTVRQWEKQSPASADIRIFNVTKQTAFKMAKEFTRVVLKAGYASQFGLIFDGTVIQYRRGRMNPTDTYVDITAQGGDAAHNFATVNTTLAAGSRPDDRYQALLRTLQPHGVTAGFRADLEGPSLPRGRVLYGMTRDCLRDLGDDTNTNWTVHNGRLEMVSRDGYLPDQAVVLTADTGLVGLPVQTTDGIMVRCLLNPLLRANGRIQLNNASIQQARLPPDYGASAGFDANIPQIAGASGPQSTFGPASPASDQDGFYRILAVDHTGDTRGNPWYSELACVALGQGATLAQAQRARS